MLNYTIIETLLTEMKPRQRLYKLVKAEMKRRGHWKNKPRGKAMAKGHDPRRNKEVI